MAQSRVEDHRADRVENLERDLFCRPCDFPGSRPRVRFLRRRRWLSPRCTSPVVARTYAELPTDLHEYERVHGLRNALRDRTFVWRTGRRQAPALQHWPLDAALDWTLRPASWRPDGGGYCDFRSTHFEPCREPFVHLSARIRRLPVVLGGDDERARVARMAPAPEPTTAVGCRPVCRHRRLIQVNGGS